MLFALTSFYEEIPVLPCLIKLENLVMSFLISDTIILVSNSTSVILKKTLHTANKYLTVNGILIFRISTN